EEARAADVGRAEELDELALALVGGPKLHLTRERVAAGRGDRQRHGGHAGGGGVELRHGVRYLLGGLVLLRGYGCGQERRHDEGSESHWPAARSRRRGCGRGLLTHGLPPERVLCSGLGSWNRAGCAGR